MTRLPRDASADRFLTVAQVAREAGVEAHVARYYARVGLIQPARYAANGYRQFTMMDVKRVRFVRAAQSLGFSLAESREVIRRSRQRRTPCPLVRDIVVRRLAENRERLEYVTALQDRMHRASVRWGRMPDEVPDGETICALIEAVADVTSSAPFPPPPSRSLRASPREGVS